MLHHCLGGEGRVEKPLLGMPRCLIHALLVCVALAVALLAPLRAWAAILPACENRELVTPAPAPVPSILFADPPPPLADPSCVAPKDEPGTDSKAAPICDPRGASALAPPRVLVVNDASIRAVPSCGLELSSPMIGPAPRDTSTIHAAFALVEHATMAAATRVPPPPSELGPAYPPVRGEARAGTRPGVYHPPR